MIRHFRDSLGGRGMIKEGGDNPPKITLPFFRNSELKAFCDIASFSLSSIFL